MNDGDALSLLDELSVAMAPPSADLLAHLEARGFQARRDDAGFSASIGDGPARIALLVPTPRQEDLATFLAAAARVALRCRRMARFTIATADEDAMPGALAASDRPDLAIVACDAGADHVVVGGAGRLNAVLRFAGAAGADVHARIERDAAEFVATVAEEVRASNVGRALRKDRVEADVRGRGVGRADGLQWIDVEVALKLPPSLPPFVAETWLREIGSEGEFVLQDAAPAWGARGCGGIERAIAEVIRRSGRAPRFARRPLGTSAANAIARLECPVVGYGPAGGASETLRAIRTLASGIDLFLSRRQNPPA